MASRGVSHYYSHLLCAQGAGVEDIKGCGASFSPGVQDLIHPHAVNDVRCNAYATIPQCRICYVRSRQALPTQPGRLVHKVVFFLSPPPYSRLLIFTRRVAPTINSNSVDKAVLFQTVCRLLGSWILWRSIGARHWPYCIGLPDQKGGPAVATHLRSAVQPIRIADACPCGPPRRSRPCCRSRPAG